MTVLTVIQNVCSAPGIGLNVPTQVFASTEREHVELARMANKMAVAISKAYEWEKLNATATYTGDGSTEAFDLPSDYDRMPKEMQLWSSAQETPLTHVDSKNRWLGLGVQSYDFVINAWIKLGNQINIKPAMASGVTAKHYYQSNKIILDDDGSTTKSAFDADGDSFRLDEDLLELAIIWMWKKGKGRSYAEDLAEYEDRKEKLITEDAGSKTLYAGSPRMPRGLNIAYPQGITP